MALAAMQGRRSLRKIEAACRNHHTRQSVGFFLTKAHWNAPEVLAETALDTLKQLGWRPGMGVGAIFDDTQKKKRGKLMDAVSKIFLHAEKVYAQGHTILGCAIIYRGVVIPYAVRLWVPKSFAEETHQPSYDGEVIEYCKLTEMAAAIITDLPLTNVTVLFDAYYLCPAVTRACKSQKYRYVGVAKKNRNFFPDGRDRDKRKVSKYGAGALKRNGRWSSVEGKKYRLAERVGRLSKLGRVKLVFSRRSREKSWICMATNETRWGAKRVLSHYLNRWPIEVLFKESKQYLGLGDYQVLRYRGIERYLCLVLIAHLLLTHLAATEPGAQADDKAKPLDLGSVPQRQQALRSKLWDDTINAMETGSRNRRVGKKLKNMILLES
jgi:SRSO17 transposase